MTIPFIRDFEFEYGTCTQIGPMVHRVIANNPGPFTYTGTGVYIIGDKNVAVIDPGPITPEHQTALGAKFTDLDCKVTHLKAAKCALKPETI